MLLFTVALIAMNPVSNAAAACAGPVKACAEQAINSGRADEGMKILQAAAAKGDTAAMRMIGMLYVEGQVVAEDAEAGVGWFYEAALRGDKEAMRLVAAAFREGLGVKPDRQLAAYWSKRARS